MFEAVDEQGAVGQPGQRVVEGLVAELLLERLDVLRERWLGDSDSSGRARERPIGAFDRVRDRRTLVVDEYLGRVVASAAKSR